MDIAQTPKMSIFWLCVLLAPTLRSFIFGGLRKGGWSAGHTVIWPTTMGKPQEGMGAKLGEENGSPTGDFRRYVDAHQVSFDVRVTNINDSFYPVLPMPHKSPFYPMHLCNDSNYVLVVCVLSCVWLSAIPQTIVLQAPLSMEFSRQEYWSGLPFPTPGGLPEPGIEPASLLFPALAGDSLPLCYLESMFQLITYLPILLTLHSSTPSLGWLLILNESWTQLTTENCSCQTAFQKSVPFCSPDNSA